MTLRLRLTLWYSAVLAFIITLFGLVIYALVAYNLQYQIDYRLQETAGSIIGASSVQNVLDVKVLTVPQLDRFSASNIYVQIWQPDGQLFNSSENLVNINYTQPLDPDGIGKGQETWQDVWVDDAHLRVLTVPIRAADRQILGYLQVASPVGPMDFAKRLLLIVLAGGEVAAVLLAAVVGWWTAHRALSPLETITQAALQITRADDLSRRIPLPGEANHDEVSRLIQAFNESLERLERLFNAQRRFLADVSHELRTPLTAIRGNVDLLRRMGGADSVSLDAIQSEAERMSRLVGDLLLLAQADAGNLPIAKAPVELDTLLLDVFSEAQVLSHKVPVVIGEIDQVAVLGDHDRLKQVLLNLITNALKFTPENGRVTLALARVNDWARLTVSDTGCGIPLADIPHIFDRFYRVDKARSRALGGAGLGLSIAKRIVQMHGGKIEVISEGIPGRGTTFTVWLPLLLPKSATDTQPLAVTRPSRRFNLAETLPNLRIPRKN